MKQRHLIGALHVAVFTLATSMIHASALPLEPRLGGLAYYDPNLNITWLADAQFNSFDTWDNQVAWAAGLSIGGVTGWRLPNADVNGDNTVVECSGGSVIGCADNEMGYLNWEEGITYLTPGPFTNISNTSWWSGTAYVVDTTRAWSGGFNDYSPTSTQLKAGGRMAWAVYPGDTDSVTDTDGDGLANDIDTDDDNDTIPDMFDQPPGRDQLVPDWMVSAGGGYTCALDDSGVVCWGDNGYGKATAPALVKPMAVSAGFRHTCALDDSGVVCWGNEALGAVTVPALSNPVAVTAGQGFTCALDDSGVVCWGNNGSGQATAPALSNPVMVSAGGGHTCALDDSGVVCWGANFFGEVTVPALSNPVAVSAGWSYTCALDNTGVVCWGLNNEGQTTVPALSNPIMVSAGTAHTCVLDNTGVVCWGRNNEGQTTVPALSNPVMVSAGEGHTCALDDSGVVCWGKNFSGESTVPVLLFDKDLDGLLDSTEDANNNGVVDAGETDPLDPDTDSDGVSDGDEINNGTDPLTPDNNTGDLAPRGSPNSVLNIADVLVLQRLLLGQITPTAIELVIGDINSNGGLDVGDLELLERTVLGLTP